MPSLLKHLPKSFKTIWCPCDTEDSNIVKALKADGRDVIATHISTGEDFFTTEKECDCIVTNCPYSCKNAFIKRCNDLQKPWALLLPLDSLCGSKRFQIYKQALWTPSVITIASRVDFTGKKSPWFNVCWVISCPSIEGKWIQEDIK